MMESETAGDPAGKTLRWTRKSTYNISDALKNENGTKICPNSSYIKSPYNLNNI